MFSCGYQFHWVEVAFRDTGPKRENERQSFEDARKGKATEWKLFHREGRPAPERHIIDTSEWTCANYQYVMG